MTEPGKGGNKPLARVVANTGPKDTFLDEKFANAVIDRINALSNISSVPNGVLKFTLSDSNLVVEFAAGGTGNIIVAAIRNGEAGYFGTIATTPFTVFP